MNMKMMLMFRKAKALLNDRSSPEERRQAGTIFVSCVAVSAFLGVLLLLKTLFLAMMAGLVLGGLAWFFSRGK